MRSRDHARLFGTKEGELLIAGVPVSLLAERVGSTPFFAYDRSLLDLRVDELRRALPLGVELSYAMKANPMPAIVQHLARRVDRLDVASSLELLTSLDTPLPPAAISFAGPGKTPDEVRQAVAAGAILEVESPTEIVRAIEAGEKLSVRPTLAIRVNPGFAVKGSGMHMGGGPQQFGIDAEEVPSVLRQYGTSGPDFVGFHVFAGSQNLNAATISEAQRLTVELLVSLAKHVPEPVRYVNLGGGFGIPYSEKQQPLQLSAVAEPLHALVEGFLAQELPQAKPVVELGRYLVGECGVYVTRVLDRKVSRGRTYLVVDGGMHHQLATSGNFGQVIRRNYPMVVGGRADADPDEEVSVVGCLCTPLDLLGDRVRLPEAGIGDLIVIFQQGAYDLTASPTAFLGHPAPAEVLV